MCGLGFIGSGLVPESCYIYGHSQKFSHGDSS